MISLTSTLQLTFQRYQSQVSPTGRRLEHSGSMGEARSLLGASHREISTKRRDSDRYPLCGRFPYTYFTLPRAESRCCAKHTWVHPFIVASPRQGQVWYKECAETAPCAVMVHAHLMWHIRVHRLVEYEVAGRNVKWLRCIEVSTQQSHHVSLLRFWFQSCEQHSAPPLDAANVKRRKSPFIFLL